MIHNLRLSLICALFACVAVMISVGCFHAIQAEEQTELNTLGTEVSESQISLASVAMNKPGEGLSVALLNPENTVKLHAGLDALAVFSSARPFPSGNPLFVLPESPFGLETNTFDAHARQSYLGAVFSGKEIQGFKPGAEILTFFQNDDLSADDYGLLVYYAYGELKNEDWRFAAGLQQDVFNPVSPTVVYLTKLYGSGNTGSYRGQFRVERFWQDDDIGLTLQAALSEPIATLVDSNGGRLTEDDGLPNLEARLELGLGEKQKLHGTEARPWELGISGVIGQTRTSRTLLGDPALLPPRAEIKTWGVGADFEHRPNSWFGSRGEVYLGQAMGEYNGGITQSFNSDNFEEILSYGGFGEIYFYLNDLVHLHLGHGVDDPRNSDLAATQFTLNQTSFINLVWNLSANLEVGLQVDYRRTDYTEFLPNILSSNDAVLVATRCLWRF